MGVDDIEGRPPISTHSDEGSKAHIEVGRENIHNAIAPHETYEGRHRFDPHVEWTAAEEKRVVRKTDMYLLSWLCVMVSVSVHHDSSDRHSQGLVLWSST